MKTKSIITKTVKSQQHGPIQDSYKLVQLKILSDIKKL